MHNYFQDVELKQEIYKLMHPFIFSFIHLFQQYHEDLFIELIFPYNTDNHVHTLDDNLTFCNRTIKIEPIH
jgi:hypothetical protein